MTFNDLVPGDIIFKAPMGRYPLFLYLQEIGPKVGVYMQLETGELMEATRSRDEKFFEHGWCLLRDGQVTEGNS